MKRPLSVRTTVRTTRMRTTKKQSFSVRTGARTSLVRTINPLKFTLSSQPKKMGLMPLNLFDCNPVNVSGEVAKTITAQCLQAKKTIGTLFDSSMFGKQKPQESCLYPVKAHQGKSAKTALTSTLTTNQPKPVRTTEKQPLSLDTILDTTLDTSLNIETSKDLGA